MKHPLFFIVTLFIFIASFPLFSLEVSKQELESIGNNTEIIKFINYTGPYSVINTTDQISAIGTNLGKSIASDLTITKTTEENAKYIITHIVSPDIKQGLDADILFITDSASVDHIRNLRRIISSYLISAYKYSEKDADTLAVFITVYNAVHRGKINDYNKYKPTVLTYLKSDLVGLSTNYKDWPGKSQIVIPLFDATSGGLSTIDTSIISDNKVVDSIREEDGRGVDERKNLVDIKEREADIAEKDANIAQKDAVNAKKEAEETQKQAEDAKKIAEQKQETATNTQKEADEAQKKADDVKEIAAINPDDELAQKEAENAQKIADDKQKEAENAQKEATEAQKTADEVEKKADVAKDTAEVKSKEATDNQVFADKKRSEAQKERTNIAKDQQKNITESVAESKISTSYGLNLTDRSQLFSAIVLVDTTTGKVVKESPVTLIRNRTVIPVSDGFIAIAGKNDGQNTAIRLVLIDQDNMEIIAQTVEPVSEKSILVSSDNNFYIVININGEWCLGKYSIDLRLVSKSTLTILEETPITVTDSGIVVTDSNGIIKLLDKDTLMEIKK